MTANQKLWEVIISYDTHHVDGTSPVSSSYNIIGKNQNEALQKARIMFSRGWVGRKKLVENGTYESREVRLDNYSESAVEYRTNIPLPEIEGKESQKFGLTPRISDDGKNIEYLVNDI